VSFQALLLHISYYYRNWCMAALQYLWAKPFTLLLLDLILNIKGEIVQSIENLITTFIDGLLTLIHSIYIPPSFLQDSWRTQEAVGLKDRSGTCSAMMGHYSA